MKNTYLQKFTWDENVSSCTWSIPSNRPMVNMDMLWHMFSEIPIVKENSIVQILKFYVRDQRNVFFFQSMINIILEYIEDT